MTSKYDSLNEFFQKQDVDELRMTFIEVENIVGKLPHSARHHRAWWTNNRDHTHARNGWLAAGWKTSRVDMEAKELTFVREKPDLLPFSSYSKKLDISENLIDTQELSDMNTFRRFFSEIDRSSIGTAGFLRVIRSIDQYISGDITEMELGQIIRKHWPRR